MKRRLVAIAVMELLFGCAESKRDTPAMRQTINSAAGNPPGYYAGLSDDVQSYSVEKYMKWLELNADYIEKINKHYKGISDNKESRGCIGKDVYVCVASLSQKLSISDDFNVSSLHNSHMTDINNNEIHNKTAHVYGYIPFKRGAISVYDRLSIAISINGRGIVSKVDALLPYDPIRANTFDGYDKTGVYELVTSIGDLSCNNISKIDFYKFIENDVKHRVRPYQVPPSCTMADGCTESSGVDVGGINYCGMVIGFDSSVGFSTNAINEYNNSGVVGGGSVSIR